MGSSLSSRVLLSSSNSKTIPRTPPRRSRSTSLAPMVRTARRRSGGSSPKKRSRRDRRGKVKVKARREKVKVRRARARRVKVKVRRVMTKKTKSDCEGEIFAFLSLVSIYCNLVASCNFVTTLFS